MVKKSFSYNGQPTESRIMLYRTMPFPRLSMTLDNLNFKVTELLPSMYCVHSWRAIYLR